MFVITPDFKIKQTAKNYLLVANRSFPREYIFRPRELVLTHDT